MTEIIEMFIKAAAAQYIRQRCIESTMGIPGSIDCYEAAMRLTLGWKQWPVAGLYQPRPR